MKLKTGDRVKLTKGNWPEGKNNPVWDGKHGKVSGKIIGNSRSKHFVFDVVWDNGGVNSYFEHDVELYEYEDWKNDHPVPLPEELFEV